MGLTQGTATDSAGDVRVPVFYYSNIGFTQNQTTAETLCTLDIKGVKYLNLIIENESATKRMDLTWNVYLDISSTPDAKSVKALEADVAVAAASTVQRMLSVGSHTRSTDPDAAPAVVDGLPAAWLEIQIDTEDTTACTGNIWIMGVYQ